MSNDFSHEEKATLRAYANSKSNGSYRTTCPACSPGRRNAKQQCLSVTIFSDRVVYTCHHCDAMGATYMKDDLRQPFVAPVYEKPFKPNALKKLDVALSEAAVEYLASRHISLKTAQVYGIASSVAFFPDFKREEQGIAFPYFVKGKESGHKVRAFPDKSFICTKKLDTLFGIQTVDLAESGDVIICEGEFDPISFYEAGVLNATSVPNGSGSFKNSNADGTMKESLGFLWDAREVLDKAKRILIATDADEMGDKLAEELARRLGKHRCWRVKYPEGCKDANDTLKLFGKGALVLASATAEPWEVEGIYEAVKYFDQYDNLFLNGFGERISTGMSRVDEIFSVAPGLLTIVTGNPNAGKSNFVNQICINLARQYGHVTAMCSFETPPAVHMGQISEMLMQKHFFETIDPGDRMTEKEMQSLKPFLQRHIKFIHQDDGKKATVDSIIERIKTAVFRWGVKIVVVDPYTYIYRPPEVSETSFIDDMLTKVRLTAALYGLHIFFIAHPAKPQVNADGSTPVPKGYSISGSAAWFSKADHGLSVHRSPDNNEVEICCWKTRFSWLGKNGSVKVYYDTMRHCYISENWGSMQPYGAEMA